MIPEKEKKEKVEYVLQNFNFVKVHDAMVALNWTWVDYYDDVSIKVPSIAKLVLCAQRLLYKALESPIVDHCNSVSSGGFVATYNGSGYLTLQFVLCETTSCEQ